MNILKTDDLSISLTTIFVKMVGLWKPRNHSERYIRNITLTYTLVAILYALWIQARDLYYSWGDFDTCLFNICNLLSVIMPLLKLGVLFVHQDDFFHLVAYTKQKFLYGNYNNYERKIVFDCKRQCSYFVCFLTVSTLATVVSYIVPPVVANIGRNESDRILPFNMWLDLPLAMTPYFEITFISQALSLYHVGASYCCFDNFLCIMNLHVATQFRILQRRLASINDSMNEETPVKDKIPIKDSTHFEDKSYHAFKHYIREHQALIAYCEKLEEVFNTIVLGQLLMFSMLMCLDGYHILLPDGSFSKQLIFTFHLSACLCQLLMFTYSCDCIIRESMSTAEAVYSAPWTILSMNTSGKMIRKDLILIIMRSSVPCCLTAKGFFIVSLETYTKVLSTAVSYFTLLRKNTES
ncbi:Odorant receptor 13a [Anthophora quadrimaculata]